MISVGHDSEDESESTYGQHPHKILDENDTSIIQKSTTQASAEDDLLDSKKQALLHAER